MLRSTGRKVITCDIHGAFMRADIDEVLHVRLEGSLAKLLTKVDPDLYTQFLSKENGKDVMYVHLEKALYGTLQAALLFGKTCLGT
jgi:acyl CoA:acetate/3-ketoacid CoA transferase